MNRISDLCQCPKFGLPLINFRFDAFVRYTGKRQGYRYKFFHLPPTSPSIGRKVALYAIFALSLIQ